jgi:LmbE family N-acetylglucosaminyl deacetylase
MKVFDPRTVGTSEGDWRDVLADLPTFELVRGPVVVVAPHPDDETLGAGGLIYTCSRSKNMPVTVLALTDGEHSRDDIPNLARQRISELRSATRALAGHRVRIVRLALPDGELRTHEAAIDAALEELICRHTTLVVPFILDGHPDHEAAARSARRLARKFSIGLLQYPIWAWHHTRPEQLDLGHALRLSLSVRAQRAKRLAMQCFKSQLEAKSGGPTVPKHVLKYFHRPFEVFFS